MCVSVADRREGAFSLLLLPLRQSVQAGNCPLADLHHRQIFILFSCLFPQVCLYGGYSSAECPGEETVSPPSERTSHGDQIRAGNLTKGGSMDNRV